MEEENKQQKFSKKNIVILILIVVLAVAIACCTLLFVQCRKLEEANLNLKVENEASIAIAKGILKQYDEMVEESKKIIERDKEIEERLKELDKLVTETVQKVNEYGGYGEFGSVPGEVRNRVVGIKGRTEEGSYEASAFSMFEPGLYVTCNHCIKGNDLVLVDGGKNYDIEVLKVDEEHDLALIRSSHKKSVFKGTNHNPEKNSLYINANFLSDAIHGFYTMRLYENDELTKREGDTINLIMPPFKGGSGSPVVDSNFAVVAVLSKAADSEDGKTALKIGIPIEYAEKLYDEYQNDLENESTKAD